MQSISEFLVSKNLQSHAKLWNPWEGNKTNDLQASVLLSLALLFQSISCDEFAGWWVRRVMNQPSDESAVMNAPSDECSEWWDVRESSEQGEREIDKWSFIFTYLNNIWPCQIKLTSLLLQFRLKLTDRPQKQRGKSAESPGRLTTPWRAASDPSVWPRTSSSAWSSALLYSASTETSPSTTASVVACPRTHHSQWYGGEVGEGSADQEGCDDGALPGYWWSLWQSQHRLHLECAARAWVWPHDGAVVCSLLG